MSGLTIGLIAGCAVGVALIVCCLRSILKDKNKLTKKTKQVQEINEAEDYDVEAPSDAAGTGKPQAHHEYQKQGVDASENGLSQSINNGPRMSTPEKRGGESRVGIEATERKTVDPGAQRDVVSQGLDMSSSASGKAPRGRRIERDVSTPSRHTARRTLDSYSPRRD